MQMMFDKSMLPELVALAQRIQNRSGSYGLINYEVYHDACACMGPSPGDKLCSCRQRESLNKNMVEVVSQFDEDLAKTISLARFSRDLPKE